MSSNLVLKGKLSFLNLGELLQLFGSSGSTGILKLTSTHTDSPGFIYIIDGNPIDAVFQDQKGQDVLNIFLVGWKQNLNSAMRKYCIAGRLIKIGWS